MRTPMGISQKVVKPSRHGLRRPADARLVVGPEAGPVGRNGLEALRKDGLEGRHLAARGDRRQREQKNRARPGALSSDGAGHLHADP